MFEKIKNFFIKIKNFIAEAFWFIFFIILGGLVGGLILFLTSAFIRHAFLISLIVAAFFMIFHISDVRNYFREKNWIGFFGRLFVVFVISSYIGGFIAFASGLIEIKFDWIDSLLLKISFLISYPLFIFSVILQKFFPKSRLYNDLQKILRGLDILGVFPR